MSLSETLRAVGRGERVRVTLRGRAVADLVPVGSGVDPLVALIDQGRITPATRARPTQAPHPIPAVRSASALVVAERDGER